MRRKLVLLVFTISLGCSHSPTEPKPRPVKRAADTICRGGWLISLGRLDEPTDSTYTGCT